jgi:hypothetical protein
MLVAGHCRYTFKGSGLFHWEASEAVQAHNVLGLPDPRLLMLAPGVQLFTESEDAFFLRVRQARRSLFPGPMLTRSHYHHTATDESLHPTAPPIPNPPPPPPPFPPVPGLQLAQLAGMLNRTLVIPNPPCDSMW